MRTIVLLSLIFISSGLLAKNVNPGYKFKKGQMLEYRMVQNQKMHMTVERYTSEIEQTNQYEMSFEVKDATKQEVNFVFKLNNVQLNVNRQGKDILKTIGTQPFNMDSLLRKYILDRTFFIRMDVYGNIVSVTPPEFSFNPYDMDTLQYDALMEFANRENIRTLVQNVFMVYPRNTISSNDEWNNFYYLDAGLPVKATTTITIQEVMRNNYRYRFSGQFSAPIPTSKETERKNTSGINGPLHGKITTLRKNGWVVKKDWTGNFTGEVWVDKHKVILKNEMTFTSEKLN